MAKTHAQHIGLVASKASRWLGDLFVPWQWTEGTITDFLNAETDEERRVLTNLFVTTTLTNYNTIGVTVSTSTKDCRAAANVIVVSSGRRRHIWRVQLVQHRAHSLDRQSGVVLGAGLRLRFHQRNGTMQRVIATVAVPLAKYRADSSRGRLPKDTVVAVESATAPAVDLGLPGTAVESEHRAFCGGVGHRSLEPRMCLEASRAD